MSYRFLFFVGWGVLGYFRCYGCICFQHCLFCFCCCVVGFRGAFVGLPRLYKVLKGVLGISIDIEIFGNTLHLQSLDNSAIM